MLREKLTELRLTPTKPSNYKTFRLPSNVNSPLSTKLQHQQPHPKVAESESIGANHLGFVKSLFQHYCQHLGLNPNHILVESAFNFYVNERIAYLLGTATNTELARETFYNELIQNSSLPTNYNFTSIITEINKKIEHYIQQRYPIIYASKGKRKLQTPAVTLQRIQPPTWKKHRIELPTNLLYYYIPRSIINIAAVGFQSPLSQPDFGTTSPWEVTESEGEQEKEEKEKSENQKFTYQNPIPENPEFETPNQPLQQLIQHPQQPIQQPPVLPLQQQQPMAFAPIAKLKKFTGKENNTQAWINNIAKAITANNWDDQRALQAIPYFLQNTTDSCSILQHVHTLHLNTFQDAVTHARDFESAKLEANHTQAINLVMNGSSELDSKLKQFSNSINQKLEGYLANNCPIYQPLQ
ncbi:hypothetical protein G9A89_004675 [Geosiphon pyriformis]|nr:hypothetical protein G9A89_004675 [Geosiphon pyriformis]